LCYLRMISSEGYALPFTSLYTAFRDGKDQLYLSW
jgi:hypothetical protein